MRNLVQGLFVSATLFCAARPGLAAPEPHRLQPSAPRTVSIAETGTPPVIRAGILQSTLIMLPAEEKVATVFGGDTVDWIFDGGHVASRFISIKPKIANSTTDVYSFPTTETSTPYSSGRFRAMKTRTSTPRFSSVLPTKPVRNVLSNFQFLCLSQS